MLSNGTIFINSADNEAKIVDKNHILNLQHTHDYTTFTSVVFNSVITGSWKGDIKIWNCEIPFPIVCLKGHIDAINCIISLKQSFIVSASEDRTLKLWDLSKLCVLMTVNISTPIHYMLSLNNGTFITASRNGDLKMWDSQLTCLADLVNPEECNIIEKMKLLNF